MTLESGGARDDTLSSTRFRRQSRRAGDARSANPAIAAGVLREVLLVVVLRVVERRRRGDFRRDFPESGARKRALVIFLGCLRGVLLLLAEGIDGRTVLRSHVVSLAHPLGWIVVLPEDAQQLFVADAPRI